jgi:hypothetical protein
LSKLLIEEDVVVKHFNKSTIENAKKLFSTIDVAINHGSFWVSYGGGTLNVMASILAKNTGESYEKMKAAIELIGPIWWHSDNWYAELQHKAKAAKSGKYYAWDAKSVAGSVTVRNTTVRNTTVGNTTVRNTTIENITAET